jgi:predicted ATPase
MHIESIAIKNFRTFRDVRLENIPKLCVLVGANGCGKSTFFKVFSFLNDALAMNVTKAVTKHGGWKDLVSRGHDREPISLELKFRLPILGKERLVTYILEFAPASNGKMQITKEILRYKRGSYGQPKHFLDFSLGKGRAIINEEDFDKDDEELTEETQELEAPDILAVKGLGQFEKFKAASAFRQMLENWHISDFRISDVQGSQDFGLAEHLSVKGDNLAQVAHFIFEHHPDTFQKIREAMKRRIPGVVDIDPSPTEDGRLLLRFRDGEFKDPFLARNVSDGTIKMFAYLVLLYDPVPFPVLAIEEPENQLYQDLLSPLVEEFRDYARRGGQVFLSSHSVELLNQMDLSEIYSLKKQDGFTQVSHASDNELLRNLVAEGDVPGDLWRQGLLSGVNKI